MICGVCIVCCTQTEYKFYNNNYYSSVSSFDDSSITPLSFLLRIFPVTRGTCLLCISGALCQRKAWCAGSLESSLVTRNLVFVTGLLPPGLGILGIPGEEVDRSVSCLGRIPLLASNSLL